ncbi:hypothetical protein GGTG_01801 [Gaeumannomyces tritici R3-111a-1]|uniref:Uncharacterized protein n=1 Tax=Gaeumannomyces tritici (strain R3-111a-1) TaxID=644352 RepID=J3NKL0_GAET3|nr:hypothetical protein GGTG_01801 [Gaeumannomyces tritici R3-111a-1]EJT81827.1 hypothetical protein GGTG_01801 [Gaeumannomyces tritici R3-111a-1]
MQSIAHFEKPVKGMLNAIRQSNYRTLNQKKSILKLFIGALKLNWKIYKKNRLNAVSKKTKTSENHVLFVSATIIAVKIVSAESGTFRRQYGRRTLTGNRAVISLNIRMRRNRSKASGNVTKKITIPFSKRLKNAFISVNNFALNALLNNGLTFVTRKLFGQYSIKGFGFLNNFANAKLNFNKLFKKFRYRFKQPFINAYRYTGVNGIVLICLIIKITAIKYRTFRIIIFKKRQINKIPIIALLEIDNLLQRERVINTHIKRKGSNIRFGGKFIKIKSIAAALVTHFTLFFGGNLFAAAVKARRGVTGKTFAGILKGYKRKRAR